MISFDVIDKNEFRLDTTQIRNIVPIVLIGNKRRACSFIDILNRSSPEFRSLLKLKVGELIPFKMVDYADANGSVDNAQELVRSKKINLLCMYSDGLTEQTKSMMHDWFSLVMGQNVGGYIQSISTIYLTTGNSKLKITRVVHRQNVTELTFNSFHRRNPERARSILWPDILTIKTDDAIRKGHNCLTKEKCDICSSATSMTLMVNFSCGHRSCMECAGAIVTVSKCCPFCRAPVVLEKLVLNVPYVPSVFMCIKEIIESMEDRMETSKMMKVKSESYQSIIYLDTFVAVQHLYNFITDRMKNIKDQFAVIDVMDAIETDRNAYYIGCSNQTARDLKRLQKIIVSPDTKIGERIMLDHKSYGATYGDDQELIIIKSSN